jgi:Electron transfer DM13
MRHHHLPSALLVSLLLAGCAGNKTPTAPDATPPAAGLITPTGPGVTARLVKTRYDVTGTVTVAIENGVARVDLSSDYGIMQTPNPVLYLNTTNNPNTGKPIRVASLKGKNGANRFVFAVPAGVRYTWAIIWCDPANVEMAEAALPAVP